MKSFTTKFINSHKLPLVIEPHPSHTKMTKSDFYKHVSDNKEVIQKKLLENGGILFRGFPLEDQRDFWHFIKNLGTGEFIDYIGGDSPRTKIEEGIYTSTEAPPAIKIPLHNELSFVKKYPNHIFFFCQIAPQERGETIIADARKVYRTVNKDVRQKFIDKGLKYISRYYYQSKLMDLINSIQKSHKPWMNVFETHDKKLVEKLCHENEFEFDWNQDDWIEIRQNRPATMMHPITHEDVWFNQAHLFDFNPKLLGWWRYFGAKLVYCRKHMRMHEVYFKDYEKIPREDLYHILDVLDQNTISFPWQKGDVMVLDNVLAMHGRAPFAGKRRVLTAMTG